MSDELLAPVVLVVDDDDDHNFVVSMSLEALGYDVRSASSCAAARAMLAREKTDALLSDLSLGDGTALDLVASLERRPRVAIVLTGFDDVGPNVRAAFDAVLLKPTAIEHVDELLRERLSAPRDEDEDDEVVESGFVPKRLATTRPSAQHRRGAA